MILKIKLLIYKNYEGDDLYKELIEFNVYWYIIINISVILVICREFSILYWIVYCLIVF